LRIADKTGRQLSEQPIVAFQWERQSILFFDKLVSAK
jgi:hypothetical protein